MKLSIRTTYSSHPKTGAGRIIAKCGGRQHTMPYDHSLGGDKSHKEAARQLAEKLGLEGAWVEDPKDTPRKRLFRQDIEGEAAFVALVVNRIAVARS